MIDFETPNLERILKPPKGLGIEKDEAGDRRSAWIKIKRTREGYPKLLMVDGVIYKRLFDTPYYSPVDATRKEYEIFYNHFALEYERMSKYVAPIAGYMINEMRSFNSSLDARVLDLCAGTGIVSEELVLNGYSDITLLDFSQAMIEEARKKERLRGCNFVVKDFLAWKPKQRYDIVICIMGMHYFDKDLDRFLEKVRSVCKPNGLFACAQTYSFDDELTGSFQLLSEGGMEANNRGNKFRVYYFVGRNNVEHPSRPNGFLGWLQELDEIGVRCPFAER